MTPHLAACYFLEKKEPDGQYDRLARVLEFSARRLCPRWTMQIARIAPTLLAPCTGNPSHAWNHAKLEWWASVVDAAPEGTELIIMDADMVIVRPLAPIWQVPFDLAYTVRQRSRLPLNGGLVALRVSAGTRAAIRQWRDLDAEMMVNGQRHGPWHRKYMGMNQASFGCLLEEGGFAGLHLHQLRCQEWNLCEWADYSPTTRVIHVKSRLRRAVFGSGVHAELAPLVTVWHEIERRMLAAERMSA